MKDAWCSCMLDARIRDSINDCQHFASFDTTKIGTCNVYQHIGGTFTKIRIIGQGNCQMLENKSTALVLNQTLENQCRLNLD